MVVVDSVLEACGRTFRLDTTNETPVDQDCECVVHRLTRDGTYFEARHPRNGVGRNVGFGAHRSQYGQALCRRLHAMSSQQLG